MGFRFEFDATNQILLIVFEGRITERAIEDCSTALRKIGIRPRFTLIDYTTVTQVDLPVEHIKSAARIPPPASATRVFIAPQDLLYGLSRMFEILGGDLWPNTYVVHTMEEALERIGVEAPSFSALHVDL